MLLADAEWNGDNESELHCVSTKPYGGSTVTRLVGITEFKEFVKDTKPDLWAFHNGLTADVPVINKIAGEELINPLRVKDTFVASRLFNYNKFCTHSLKELGEFLGTYKGDYDGGWDYYTTEMGEYCDQDVEVLESIVKYYWKNLHCPSWAKALRAEFDTAILCREMQDNGFMFDFDKAIHTLGDVKREMQELEDNFKVAFPPTLVEVKRLKYRKKLDGTLYTNVIKAIAEYPKTEVEGDELVVYDYKNFNPGSPQDRIDVLWDAGWKPFDKTKGHIQKLKELRRR